jgi:methyl-accepting chemotaxis protein
MTEAPRVESISSHYSRRIGAALAITLTVTLAFGALFAAHAASTEGSLAGVAGTLFVVTLNLGLLGIVLGGNVAVELRNLTEAAEAIEDGDLDASPDVDRADEFGQLATAFDSMRGSLRDALQESETAREEAEEARENAEAARREAEEFNDTLIEHATAIGDAMTAAADGDFTRRLDAETEIDAVSRIMVAYEEMANGLSETVDEIREFATVVEQASTSVADDAADSIDVSSSDENFGLVTVDDTLDGLQDLLSRTLAHLALIVDDVRDSCIGHTGPLCHVTNGGS